jgi:predicted short-subunit dehydrogenase-like oxidoreductase (DUF2520 family)
MQAVSIIGLGRVGSALATALQGAGYKIDMLIVREPSKALNPNGLDDTSVSCGTLKEVGDLTSDAIFITTQDSEIEPAARRLAKAVGKTWRPFVFHTSGVHSSELLSPLSDLGCETASLHPLVSVSRGNSDKNIFRGSRFAVEGTEKAVAAAQGLVARLGGKSFFVSTDSKVLYHAAAVVACGHLTALFEVSIRMMEECGIERATAKDVLLPLVESTVRNLDAQSVSGALTGPFSRADVDTIKRHIKKIDTLSDKRIGDVYRILGEISVDLAGGQGAKPDSLAVIRKLLVKTIPK